MNHVLSLKYRFLPACHTCAKAAEIFLGDLNSVTFSISLPTGMSPFTCGCVPFLSRVCHFSLAGMSPFTREYATFHTRVCHLSSAGIPLFTRGHVTFYSWECHFSLLGLSPFTRGFVTFHSWVCHLSLARIISSSRGYVTFRSRICHHSLVGMSPFNSSTADLPKHTRNLFFCNKAFILVSRSLLFSFTHVSNVFFLTC